TEPTVDVRAEPEQNRYVAYLANGDQTRDAGEVVGFVAYERDGERWVLLHTVVLPEHEGKGIGSALARGVLDDLRSQQAPVLVRCPFLTAYIRRHPEYADLVQL